MNKKSLLFSIVFFLIFVSTSVYAVDCWSYSGNQVSCTLYSSDCTWKPTSLNPWCPNSVGCCENKGCWDYDSLGGIACEATGFCTWSEYGGQCFKSTGCCFQPFCEDVGVVDNETKCNMLIAGGMPCNWTDSDTCDDIGMLMFQDESSCLAMGGIWNTLSLSCEMPMFMGEAKCWFADFNQQVCQATTGCIYCDATTGANGTANSSSGLCYGQTAGWCQGHEPNSMGGGVATDSLACGDLTLQTPCECGPIPNCDYVNGACTEGMSTSCTLGQPPVPFCDAIDPSTNLAVNQTVCGNLSSTYMMPCKWDGSKCTFLSSAIFKNGGDIGSIMTSSDCAMAGGSWKSESYTDPWDGFVKTNEWCEMNSASYSSANCDSSCWACEFQPGGAAWGSVATAQAACEASSAVAGGCSWSTDSYAMNSLGWCNYPMTGSVGFGAFGNCDDSCFNCGMGQTACEASAADCVWVTDPMGIGGWCDPVAMADFNNASKNCMMNWDQTSCIASIANPGNGGCFWNSTYSRCTNGTLDGLTPHQFLLMEFCEVPGDEDNDGLDGCGDPDCLTNPACGFGMGGGSFGMMLPPGGPENICFAADNTNQTYCEADIINSQTVNDTVGVTYNITLRAVDPAIFNIPIELNNTQLCYYHTSPDGQGWCDPIMNQQMKGGMNMMGPPPALLGTDPVGDILNNRTTQYWLDIVGVGLMNDPQMISIGIPIYNATNFSGCNKVYSSTTRNETGKYYRFIDVDNDATTGCSAYDTAGTLVAGFDYRIDLVVNSTSLGYQDNITSYRCLNNEWVSYSATMTYMAEGCSMSPPPNDPIFGGTTFTGTNMLNIQKKDIGNPTGTLRIYVSTANASRNYTNPVDVAGPFYYTPGTVDFKFECCDCPGQDMDGDGYTSEQDPDCKSFKQFGYVKFEDCFSPQDDDSDGLVNCADPDCKYDTYICGGSFNSTFIASLNDTTAPSIVWLKAQTFPDAAFIIYDTNEPANGTLLFYGNNTTCSNLTATVYDMGIIDPNMQDYKNWHDGPLDNFVNNPQKLSAALTNNKTYYYKLKTCDPSGNCAVSSCLNFTTPYNMNKSNCPMCNFTMKFAYTPPTGYDQSHPLGNMSVEFDTNNDGTYDFEVGDHNASTGYMDYTQVKNITIKFDNPNSTQNWSIEFINADMTGALSKLSSITAIDGSSGMVYNNTQLSSGSNETYMGLSSSQWQLMKAMSPKYLNISIQGDMDELWHCSDDLQTCVNKTNETIDHFYDSSTNTTEWMMATTTSMFSVYGGAQYVAPTTITPPAATVSPGGGGGGGGGGASGMSYLYDEANDKVTISLWSVTANKEAYVNFDALGINQFNLTLTKSIDSTKYAKIYLYKVNTVNVSDPEGKVYTYYKIESVNVSDIYKLKFKFEVGKNWITENNIDESTIRMQRYTDSWKILPTTILSTGNDQSVFVSESTGLSYFAITGLASGEEYTDTSEEIVPEDLEPTYEEEPTAMSPMMYGLAIFLIVIALVYFLLVSKKGKKR